jgi:hypothetical protein
VTVGAHDFARKFSCLPCLYGVSGRLLSCGVRFPLKQLPQVGKYYLCEDVLFIYMNRNWSFSGRTNECDEIGHLVAEPTNVMNFHSLHHKLHAIGPLWD